MSKKNVEKENSVLLTKKKSYDVALNLILESNCFLQNMLFYHFGYQSG